MRNAAAAGTLDESWQLEGQKPGLLKTMRAAWLCVCNENGIRQIVYTLRS